MFKGIGIDIVEVDRIKAAMEKGERFLTRNFTENELIYIEGKGRKPQTVAGMFAAKEAVAKVLGTGIRGFRLVEVEIAHNDLGKPYVVLLGDAEAVAKQAGILEVQISISHSEAYAVANGIGLGGSN